MTSRALNLEERAAGDFGGVEAETDAVTENAPTKPWTGFDARGARVGGARHRRGMDLDIGRVLTAVIQSDECVFKTLPRHSRLRGCIYTPMVQSFRFLQLIHRYFLSFPLVSLPRLEEDPRRREYLRADLMEGVFGQAIWCMSMRRKL